MVAVAERLKSIWRMEMTMVADAETKEIVPRALEAILFKPPNSLNTRWVIHQTKLASLSSDSLKFCLVPILSFDGRPSKEDHLMLSLRT